MSHLEFRDSIFSRKIKDRVWEKGEIIFDVSPAVFRRDYLGSWIKKDEYGNIHSDYGWVIDHIDPDSSNVSDPIGNLQPIQWKNKIQKDCENKTQKSNH